MFPLRLDALRFAPPGRVILDSLDLELGGEGISLILGPNGVGKTLLLRLIAGLLTPDGRPIDWGETSASSGRLAMVFQQPMLFRLSVFANVEFALRPQAPVGGRAQARAPVNVLDRVGLCPSCRRLCAPALRRRTPTPGAGAGLGDAPAPVAAR